MGEKSVSRLDPVLKVKEAAPLVGVGVNKLMELIHSGDFTNAYQTGGKTSPWVIPESDILAYRQKQAKKRVA